jgi:hypothetical protein
MSIGSLQPRRPWLAGLGLWVLIAGPGFLVLPSCQHAPSNSAQRGDAWNLPFDFESGTQEGEVTVREDTEVEIRYRKPYQSPPRLVLVELRGAQALETHYSKEDFQIISQGANYFRVRNNHSEHGSSWATIKWRAEGALAKGGANGLQSEPDQPGQPAKSPQEVVIERVKNAGGKVGIDPNAPPDPDATIRLADREKEPGKPLDVTLTSTVDPRLKKNAVISIDLHRTKTADADLTQLADLKSLRTLNLYGTKITDAGLQSLSGLTNLQTLYLSGTAVTDAGLQNLQGLKKLNELGLNQTRVTDQGLVYLQGLTNLHSLSLVSTGVTDQGVQQLKTMRSLKHLFVGHTKISANGIEELKKALPQTQILK